LIAAEEGFFSDAGVDTPDPNDPILYLDGAGIFISIFFSIIISPIFFF
jgi:hypothetical protein